MNAAAAMVEDLRRHLALCQEVLAPDRVLYAMDDPYQVSREEVDAYDRMNMPAEHKRMLMQTNAERVFRLSRA